MVLLAIVALAAACSGSSSEEAEGPTTTIEDYPDALTRRLQRLAAAPRPVPRSALPPRHLDAEKFPETLVERSLIVSGGPEPDAIASIDQPRFEPVGEVDWLADNEPVISLTIEGVARAYPVQILVWHEIVNDVVDGRPVVISYCPLCNSAVAFDRTVDGTVLDFGTSGSLYQSALVMYDRQSESLWTHFDGRAVIGDQIGTRLELIPVATVSWQDFRQANPGAEVLLPASSRAPYGRNPYGAYDSRDEPLAFFNGEVDPRLAPMARVVGVEVEERTVAVALDELRERGTVTVEVGGRSVVVWWRGGTVSALSHPRILDGDDVGATGAFLTSERFEVTTEGFVSEESGTTFDILGRGIEGAAQGDQLTPVAHIDTFWFAWSSYHPETELIG